MSNYYDDNFGHYECEPGDEDETREFYFQVQRESVMKTCKGCGNRVKLRRDYAICNSCADRAERGGDY